MGSAVTTDVEPQPEPQVSQVLNAKQRQGFLGRLAEFEMQLLALTPMQQSFCLAVLEDPTNNSAAARKAGYSGQNASVIAARLMSHSAVSAVIALGSQLREDRTMITSDRTLNELAIIAFSNIGDYEVRPGTNQVVTREGVPEYALRAVSSAEFSTTVEETADGGSKTTYKSRIKLWPKTEALRMLAMYQKLLAGDGPNITLNDNRGQVHNHQHNVWEIGGKKVQF